MNQKRLELLRSAGVDPKGHAHVQSGHPTHEHKAKKGKGKGKKKHASGAHLPVAGVDFVFGGKGTAHDHQTKHKKRNPFMGVDHEKLKAVYSQAQEHYADAVNSAVSSVDTILPKLPQTIRQTFLTAFQGLKSYKKGLTSHSYESTYQKVSDGLVSYKIVKPELKYTLRMPHVVPSETIAGTASLLSKLINATIAFLRIYTTNLEHRKAYGFYEFRAELYKMANAKSNCIEIHAAMIHEQNKILMKNPSNTTQLHRVHDSRNKSGPSYYPSTITRESAEHGFDTNGFSMAHPFTP